MFLLRSKEYVAEFFSSLAAQLAIQKESEKNINVIYPVIWLYKQRKKHTMYCRI